VIVATGSRREPTPWHDRNIQSDKTWSGPRLFTGALFALRQIDLHGMNVLLVAREPVAYVAATLAHFRLYALNLTAWVLIRVGE
jgi:hypothetical protein